MLRRGFLASILSLPFASCFPDAAPARSKAPWALIGKPGAKPFVYRVKDLGYQPIWLEGNAYASVCRVFFIETKDGTLADYCVIERELLILMDDPDAYIRSEVHGHIEGMKQAWERKHLGI